MKFVSWIKSKLKAGQATGSNPDGEWIVTLSDTHVFCKRPNGNIESVDWDELKAVILETTDEGPFMPDVFWLLIGERSGCIIPQSAIGADALLEKLQKLPGFDNNVVIEAMSSTENRRFICWQRKEATAI